MKIRLFILSIFLSILLFSCVQEQEYQFELLTKEVTGLDFQNTLTPSLELNVFNYMYFYNGGGIGAGDLNNDGLIDLVFTANQSDNRIYLNEGNFEFKDVTESARFTSDGGWSNGVAINDVNQDGLLDIYISQVGQMNTINSRNLLFICQGINDQGIPTYEESAEEYGLDLVGFGTQALFFDFDLDGDLDFFQLNHSLHKNGTFGQRTSFQGKFHDLSGDRLFENVNGKYVEITESSGIDSNKIGYGLGLAAGDINMDGYPDLYIGNDFHENDYLYINNGDGTFSEKLTEQIRHTSRFSMGVDIADFNNDLSPDIISLDMLPYDPYILKKSEGEDALDIFRFKLGYGYNHQYAKNALQMNNGNGTFSEIAMFSGVHATDWSWSPLFTDINNDGWKDLFVTNGIPKRMNDIDYINFMSNDDVQFRVQYENMEEKDLNIIDRIPEIKLPNRIYLNNKDLIFKDISQDVRNHLAGYSNGAVAVDLDNDGDLDFVTNNIDEAPFIYRNELKSTKDHYIKIELKGQKGNLRGIGTKLLVFAEGEKQVYEKYSTRGFQSSSNLPVHIGIGETKIDSMIVSWPGGYVHKVLNPSLDTTIELSRSEARKSSMLIPQSSFFTIEDVTDSMKIDFKHQENPFVEFNREPLIPHATSTEGPALGIGDFNADGLQDIFIGSSKRNLPGIFLGNNSTFIREEYKMLLLDSIHEEVAVEVIDLNNDGFDDLVLGSGGNEYYFEDSVAKSRIMLNTGNGDFTKFYIDNIYNTISDLEILDIDNDGTYELLLGSRAVSWNYGKIPESHIVRINKDYSTTIVTQQYCEAFTDLGMIKKMEKVDIDRDGDEDIIVALEWGGIKLLRNTGSKLELESIFDEKGWWNFTKTADFDGDGDMDILLGNLGLNSRLKASRDQPIRLYYNDFDGNGQYEQILSYYIDGKEIPFSNMMEIEKQIPEIKKRFLHAESFASASMEEIFTEEKLESSSVLEATNFQHGFLINDNGSFRFEALAKQLQLYTFYDAEVLDGGNRIFLAGNFFDNNIQMGRNDANYGTVLKKEGAFRYSVQHPSDAILRSQVKDIESLRIGSENYYLIASNNDSLRLIKIK